MPLPSYVSRVAWTEESSSSTVIRIIPSYTFSNATNIDLTEIFLELNAYNMLFIGMNDVKVQIVDSLGRVSFTNTVTLSEFVQMDRNRRQAKLYFLLNTDVFTYLGYEHSLNLLREKAHKDMDVPKSVFDLVANFKAHCKERDQSYWSGLFHLFIRVNAFPGFKSNMIPLRNVWMDCGLPPDDFDEPNSNVALKYEALLGVDSVFAP